MRRKDWPTYKAELMKRVELGDGDNILYVACGNGHLLGELSKKARVNAYGVDISENMIAVAREQHPDCVFTVQLFTPVVRLLANTVVFSFSKTGDVKGYSQKN